MYIAFDSLTTSYAHQWSELVQHGLDQARAWIWHMRTGKTKTGIDNAAGLWQWDLIDGVILISPAGIHREWSERELQKHCCVPFESFTWDAAKSRTKKAARHREELLATPSDRMLFVSFNKEALRSATSWDLMVKLATERRMLLIVDEAHHFRNPKAQITQRLHELAPLCLYRRILTATPMGNCPLGLWALYQILSPGALGFDEVHWFRKHFATFRRVSMEPITPGGRPRVFQQVTGYQNLPELRQQIAQWSSVITRSDCSDLPDLIRTQRFIELPPELWKTYKQLRDEFLVLLDSDSEVSAAEGGARLIKLMQVLCGWVKDDYGQIHELLPIDKCPRLEALGDMLEQCPGKLVVWCRHRYDINRVARYVHGIRPNHVLQFHGDVSQRDRHTVRTLMIEDPRPFVFTGTPDSGAEGLNLSAADHIVWFSHTSNLVFRSQADERASMPGKDEVHITDFCVPGTVEAKALEMLEQKRCLANDLAGEGLKEVLRAMLTRSELPPVATPWALAA